MSVSYIPHKGKKVMFVDYSKCKNVQETLDVLKIAKQEYLKSNEMILALNDFSDAFGNTEFMTEVRKLSKELFDKKSLKLAAIGVVGLKKVLLNAYNVFAAKKVAVFNTKTEALDYLVK
jgi:hypothetical protein